MKLWKLIIVLFSLNFFIKYNFIIYSKMTIARILKPTTIFTMKQILSLKVVDQLLVLSWQMSYWQTITRRSIPHWMLCMGIKTEFIHNIEYIHSTNPCITLSPSEHLSQNWKQDSRRKCVRNSTPTVHEHKRYSSETGRLYQWHIIKVHVNE